MAVGTAPRNTISVTVPLKPPNEHLFVMLTEFRLESGRFLLGHLLKTPLALSPATIEGVSVSSRDSSANNEKAP
jgi:hypothetical protein